MQMERNYGEEIDAIRKQLEELQARMSSLPGKTPAAEQELPSAGAGTEKLKRVHVMRGMHPDSRLSGMMEELCYRTEETGESGFVTYLGVYNSGGHQYNWIRNDVSADRLLSLIESGVAGKVLACVGSADRLAILLELLRGPRTVAALVEKCGFGSTGQAYHHMKPLLAADIIAENERQKGVYTVRSRKVQGIIMLLAGISDMVDETYTQEAGESAAENGETAGTGSGEGGDAS